MNVKLSDLSLIGWLLTLATVGLVVVLMIFSGELWAQGLPSGRYPALLLALPGLIAGILFFPISAAILKRVGMPVVRQRPQG